MTALTILAGVPADHILSRLQKAGGNEIGSGKLASPESSAALAINCFGWFIPRPEQLPSLPGLEDAGTPEVIDVEFCARFPWSGGRHPWLDAVVITPTVLMGIESKRFEPYRDQKSVTLSDAYNRPVWGDNMTGYERMRDRLRSREERFVHLDAAQLVKHAFGLVTEARRRKRNPALLYIFAEPSERSGRAILPSDHARHRAEIDRFAAQVAGDAVVFNAISYRDWLANWEPQNLELDAHRRAILKVFTP